MRQFIKNLAAVDIEPTIRQRTSLRTPARGFSSHNALHLRATTRRFQEAQQSSPATTSYTAFTSENADVEAEQKPARPAYDPSQPAVLEISADIIDQLAAESTEERALPPPTPKSLTWEERRPKAKPKVQRDPRELFGATRVPRPFDAPQPRRGKSPLDQADIRSLRPKLRRVVLQQADKESEEPKEKKSTYKKEDDDWTPPPRLTWQSQKSALEEKFPEGWNPRKRLSPDAIAGIRAIHHQFPAQYTVPVLSQKFQVSPEAIRRILKSKWRPNEEEEADRTRRWYKRGKEVWTRYSELGLKPPRKWRDEGIGKREKGWKSKEKEEREREAESLKVTRRRGGSDDDGYDGFV